MSDLQLALLAGGGVFVLAVIAFNLWQERRARGRAEKAFGERPRDTLFDAPLSTAPVSGEVSTKQLMLSGRPVKSKPLRFRSVARMRRGLLSSASLQTA